MAVYYDNSPPDETEPHPLMDPLCDSIPERCYCRSCRSEGFYDQERDCLHWIECDPEAGRHGNRCACTD